MWTLLLGLTAGLLTGCTCSGDDPSKTDGAHVPAGSDGTFPSVDMEQAGVPPAIQLYRDPWRSEAQLDLADSALPDDIDAPRTLTVPLSPPRRGTVEVDLPFALDPASRARIGSDLTVTVGGRELKYASLGGGPFSWTLKGDKLKLRMPREAPEAVLRYSGAKELVARRVLSDSGLEPSDWIVGELTLDGHTRNGLVVPAPSALTWSVDLPEGARFESVVSLDPPPFDDQESDGMAVVLEIVDDQGATEVGRQALSTVSFVDWDVDLSAHTGPTDIRLRFETMGETDFDYAFLGSPTIVGAPTGDVRRVLVIGLDTTRPDHFSWYGYDKETTPELDAIANQSGVFLRAWTPAPRTRPSFRSATTGRNPLDAVGAKNIGEVFAENGFATQGVVANIHLQPRFGFDDGFDSWRYFGRADANEQVDRALEFFEANQERDAYMFLHFMDPHLRYGAPGEYREMFVDDPDPTLPRAFQRHQVNRWTNRGELDDRKRAHIEGLYDGELRYLSSQIDRLVQSLDAMPGKTLIVVHSDHGEEFWEHGGYEHNHTLYDEVTDAVLWFRPPGGTKGGPVRSEQPATLADIAPTLYDFMGFDDVPPTDGISLRPFLEGKEPDSRGIGIAHLRYGLDRWAVVKDGHKYIIAPGPGTEELYDLSADPGEQANLLPGTSPSPWRAAMAPAHPGLTTGMGWRIDVTLPRAANVSELPGMEFTLPAEAKAAGILDPELQLAGGRANKAWGERPRKTAEEVGHVELSEDGRTLVYTPGPKPDGLIWVIFDEADGDLTSPEGTQLKVGGADVELTPAGDEAGEGAVRYIGASGQRARIRPGFVIVPPPDEAARMAALDGTGPDDADRGDSETCQLCGLGYITGPACDICEE